jgi:hypothetical protein
MLISASTPHFPSARPFSGRAPLPDIEQYFLLLSIRRHAHLRTHHSANRVFTKQPVHASRQ